MNLGGNSLQNPDNSCLLLLVQNHTRVIEIKYTLIQTLKIIHSLSCSLASTHTTTHTQTNKYKRTHTNTITHTHTLVQIHTHEQTHTHTCCVWCRITVVNFLMCVCVRACVHVYVCVRVYVCVCVSVCFGFPLLLVQNQSANYQITCSLTHHTHNTPHSLTQTCIHTHTYTY